MLVTVDSAELTRRLLEADLARLALRRTTREWRELGKQILEERTRGRDRQDGAPGPERPDGGPARGG
jgi:hypothetical protein